MTTYYQRSIKDDASEHDVNTPLHPHPPTLPKQENVRASNTTTRYHHRNIYVTSKTCTVAEYREYVTPKISTSDDMCKYIQTSC